MNATQTESYPLVTFLIKDVPYAFSSQHVRTMVALPKVTPVPQAPAYVRGVVNLRGQVLPLADLRMRLGLASNRHELREFQNAMAQGEQEHRRWLDELEDSVRQHRPFTLTHDPHECVFGRWLDAYADDNQRVAAVLRKFAEPHARLHAAAGEVAALYRDDDLEGARVLIQRTRSGDLAALTRLFQDSAAFFQEENREIALVVEGPRFDYAVIVDSIQAVEFLDDETIADVPAGLNVDPANALVRALGRRRGNNSVVQILDVEKICEAVDLEGLTPGA